MLDDANNISSTENLDYIYRNMNVLCVNNLIILVNYLLFLHRQVSS
jgi:hypothetical protein